MIRHFAHCVAVLALFVGSAQAQTSTASQSQDKGAARGKAGTSAADARRHYHAAQAALYSALAHAAALEQLTDESGGSPDMDLARTYVHTIGRDAQACDGDSVKVGQAKPAIEKQESMKALRKELAEALKAADEAQNAVDGHGPLGPQAKNTQAHLQKALIALVELSEAVGVKPLPAPGADILREKQGR